MLLSYYYKWCEIFHAIQEINSIHRYLNISIFSFLLIPFKEFHFIFCNTRHKQTKETLDFLCILPSFPQLFCFLLSSFPLSAPTPSNRFVASTAYSVLVIRMRMQETVVSCTVIVLLSDLLTAKHTSISLMAEIVTAGSLSTSLVCIKSRFYDYMDIIMKIIKPQA
jgi:hypothetical protein